MSNRIYKLGSGLLIFSLLYAIFIWLFNTNSGLQFVYKTGKNFWTDNLQIEGLSGTLSGPIKINTLNYKKDHLQLSAHNIQFDCKLWDLLFKKLSVKYFNANNINLTITSPQGTISKTKTNFKNDWSILYLVNHPFKFNLQNIKLQKITFTLPQLPKPTTIDTLQLSTIGSTTAINSINLKAASPNCNLYIDAQFNGQYNINWNVSINNLNHFIADASGNLESQGKLQGKKLIQLKANAILQGKNLQFKSNKISDLKVKAITDNIQTNATNIDVNLNNIQTPQYKIESLSTKGRLILNDKSTTTLNLQFLPIKFILLGDESFNSPIINNISFEAVRHNKNISSEFSITTPIDQSKILGKLTLNKHKQINGTINWHTLNLKFLENLFSEIKNPSGKLDISLTLSGSLKKPEWNGDINLQSTSITIPIANLQLHDSHLLININPKEIKYEGQLFTNENSLNINGFTNLNTNNYSTQINITGENFLLSNSKQVQIYVSPNIKLSINDKHIDLNGSIIIPKANIELQNYSEIETLPKDVIFVNQPKSHISINSIDIYNHITLTLSDEIYFNVQGLQGNISGKILIEGTPTKTLTGNGTLTIKDGSYDMHGQNLTIKQGDLIFSNSPITNPTLNIHAFRTIKDTFKLNNKETSIGINIHGTVNKPITTLYSEPSGLSQEDILSYLLLGQPSPQADDVYGDNAKLDNQLLLMLNAIKTLNIGGSGSKFTTLTNNLRQKLGFTEMGLTTNSTENNTKDNNNKSIFSPTTSLVLGRYFSPSLYVGYSIGILDQISTIKIRYKLWKNFILQTEASTLDTGLDLLYNMTKD